METIYELIKKHSDGKGEGVMWKTVQMVSDAVEKKMTPEDKLSLMRSIYGEMANGHYDEMFAKEDVKKMYYVDDSGKKQFAPYWTKEQVREVYESVVDDIPSEYNFWDFYVALQMQKADMCQMLKKWYPDATPEDMTKKLVDLAVNWMDDPDSPHGEKKVWSYLNK